MLDLARDQQEEEPKNSLLDLARLPDSVSVDETLEVLEYAKGRVKANLDAHEANWRNKTCSEASYQKGVAKWRPKLQNLETLIAELSKEVIAA